MRALKAFGRFWYDFIIGDDPKIAAAVVLALIAAVGLLQTGALGDKAVAVFGGVLIIAFFAISLAIDVRSKR